MDLVRKILFPVVPIYYLVTWFRNKLYDWGIKKSNSYDFPIIGVGNLSVGGTGKSPMVEYLIQILRDKVLLATLSRGYKRETRGFQLVQAHHIAASVGDEPLQFKNKFPEVLVSVDADRRNGIHELRSLQPTPEVIILDDAFQHRKVKAGLYILLTAFDQLYVDDMVLPTGNLREPVSGAIRADIIVVTKCPEFLSVRDQDLISKKLKVQPWQQLFFTRIRYGNELCNGSDYRPIAFFKDQPFVLVTGIANPDPLLRFYQGIDLQFEHKKYPDHHNFSKKELQELKSHHLIVTTEKDYMRLKHHLPKEQLWFQPIQLEFIESAAVFDKTILDYIKE